MTDPILSAAAVRLSYGETVAVDGADLTLHPGDRVALMGPSGSGKSSLLHCLAGILRPDSGVVSLEGRRLDTMSEADRSATRLRRLGMVFQFGDLVPELTLLENVMLPLQLVGRRSGPARATALAVLDRLGVADVSGRRAGTVSGGQAQRAAVARALVHQPPVVLADEPTGALDSVTAESVMDTLLELTRESGAALLVVTHEHRVAAQLDRLMTMRDGLVESPVAAR